MFYDKVLEFYLHNLAPYTNLPPNRVPEDLHGIIVFAHTLSEATVFKFDRDLASYFYKKGFKNKKLDNAIEFHLPYPKVFLDFDGIVDVKLGGVGTPNYRPTSEEDLYTPETADQLRGLLLREAKIDSVADTVVYAVWNDYNISSFYLNSQNINTFYYSQMIGCAEICSLPQKHKGMYGGHPLCSGTLGSLPFESCSHAKAFGRLISLAVNCVQYINSINVERIYHPGRPAGGGKSRKKKQKRPLAPYYTLRIKEGQAVKVRSDYASGSGRTVSRPYTVRGHFRRLASGRTVWVRAHVRGVAAMKRREMALKRYDVVPRKNA